MDRISGPGFVFHLVLRGLRDGRRLPHRLWRQRARLPHRADAWSKSVTMSLRNARYIVAGGPNQVVTASVSPASSPSPTQATCPSGRINKEVGAVTAPSS